MLRAPLYILLLTAALLTALPAPAQEETEPEDDIYRKAEKVLLTPLSGFDYHDSEYLRDLELERKRRSPTGALMRSIAVPGWGQFYNDEYIKGPIFIAAQITCVVMAVDSYLTSRDYYNRSRATEDDAQREWLYQKYNDYQMETEFWGWLYVGFMAFSAMDAFVDAHLSDWDVEDLPKDEDAPGREATGDSGGRDWDLAFGLLDSATPALSLTFSPF
ncbi:MAG: DUF5683 domain-containing protein [Candidatus Dadabacteria bacterium]|nr:DUF5683 domain-containing protein [Candidatus Dadabacteria bacterium]